MPFTDAVVHGWLDSVDAVDPLYAKLHVGDPGAAGTSNPATITTRMPVTFDAAAGRVRLSTGVVQWTVDAQTYSHISYWTAASGGTLKATAPLLTPRTPGNGNQLTFQIGELRLGPVA
jgi:hypothetical protein